jgi:hypothetical protein
MLPLLCVCPDEPEEALRALTMGRIVTEVDRDVNEVPSGGLGRSVKGRA